MASLAEKTVSATEFKAKCQEIFAQLKRGEFSRVRVTKRGKPLAVVTPDNVVVADWDPESIFGCMKDWPSPVPLDHDWEKPLYSDGELDGFLRTTEEQIEAMMRRPRA